MKKNKNKSRTKRQQTAQKKEKNRQMTGEINEGAAELTVCWQKYSRFLVCIFFSLKSLFLFFPKSRDDSFAPVAACCWWCCHDQQNPLSRMRWAAVPTGIKPPGFYNPQITVSPSSPLLLVVNLWSQSPQKLDMNMMHQSHYSSVLF